MSADQWGQPSDRAAGLGGELDEYSSASDSFSDVDATGAFVVDHRSSSPGGALPSGGLPCSCVVPVWRVDWETTRARLRLGRAMAIASRCHAVSPASPRAEQLRNTAGDVTEGCSHPRVLRCSTCSGTCWTACGATREDRCAWCGMKHNRRLKVLIASGFSDRPSGFFFGTLTAPGADVLPWDRSVCSHKPDRPCSGKIGCRVVASDMAAWNTCAPQAWSWFVTYLRRLLDGHDVQFWKCWETQERGALHAHAIVWAAGVSEQRFRAAWNEAADQSWRVEHYRFAWGTERDVQRIGSTASLGEIIAEMECSNAEAVEHLDALDAEVQRKFVRYGAKYCTKGGKRAATYSRTTGELRTDGSGYRTWSASGHFGLRMKQVRANQQAYCIAQGAGAGAGSSLPSGSAPGGAAALDPQTDFYTHPRDLTVPTVAAWAQLM